jgi:AcrR family transcriptional regulator
VEEILTASGMSVGSFYYLFKNKTDLAVTLYLEIQEQFSLLVIEELAHYEQARDGIEGLVRFFLNWASEHTPEASYLVWFREREIFQLPQQEREKVHGTTCMQQLIQWLQLHMDQGTIRQLPPEQAIALWFGPANGLVQQALGAFGMFYTSPNPHARELLQTSIDPFAEAAWQTFKR